MTPAYDADGCTIYHGDCLEVMRTLPDNSVDAVVTDPPYGLVFMNRKWDAKVPGVDVWTECLRVLKPGGHLLAMGSTRTFHRLVCAIEDAGFECRDTVAWLYGSGFPKSLDVGKSIDKRKEWKAFPELQSAIKAARINAGISQSEAARRINLIGEHEALGGGGFMWFETGMKIPTRQQWILLKSCLGLSEKFDRIFEKAEREVIGSVQTERTEKGCWAGSVTGGMFRPGIREYDITSPSTDAAKQWDGFGTALKPALELISLCRKPLSEATVAANVLRWGTGCINVDGCRVETNGEALLPRENRNDITCGNCKNGHKSNPGDMVHYEPNTKGRWPANVCLSDDPEVAEAFSAFGSKTTHAKTKSGYQHNGNVYGKFSTDGSEVYPSSSGTAARFFYCAKASKRDRAGSKHPTIKPLSLIQWLSRLICPPNGFILDPFAGSGTLGEAAFREGFRSILIERESEYIEDCVRRMTGCQQVPEATQTALPFEEVA